MTKRHNQIQQESSQRNYSAVEKRTKEIYISQHKNYSKDKSIFNRFLAYASDPKTYDLPSDFFVGKSVLDAGCGNTGYFQVAMNTLGASSITCLDLGTDWIPELKLVLDEYGLSPNKVKYTEGSTTDLPFEDESFDFVASNGVIMHLETTEDAALALGELSRVTKKGGCIYIYSGIDTPGIVDRYIVPALRKAYSEDESFQKFVDNIDNEKVAAELVDCYKKSQAFDSSISNAFIESLKNLFTLDSATFTQNLLQVPVQQGPKLGFDWVKKELDRLGFKNIRRVKERYWTRNDYRKYLAPLHYHRELELAKLFYGGGHVKVIAEK